MSELGELDAVGSAELVARGDLKASELVGDAIARIEAVNPGLNAVIHPRFERAMDEAASARGAFAGVPVVIKDLNATVAGEPHHEGMRALRDAGYRDAADSGFVRRLRAAGFVIVGRTNTPELGLLPTTEPAAYGPTRNPYDTTRSPGGSSGGSGAAVAARMVPVGHGTDAGGSIRIPASACGLVGLKPSRGRVSAAPNGEEFGGMSVQHVLTRTVRDCAALLDVVAGPEPGDPHGTPPRVTSFTDAMYEPARALRVGIMTRTPNAAFPLDRACVDAVELAARALEELGHTVENAHPAALDESEFPIHFGVIAGADAASQIDLWGARIGRALGAGDVEPATWALARLGHDVTAAQLMTTRTWLGSYARRMASWWEEGFDLLLTPTLARAPISLGELTPPADQPLAAGLKALAYIPFTPPFNATGQPAISLPVGHDNAGVPVGVQLVAAFAREDLLLTVARALEETFRWHDARPAVCA